MELKDVLNKIEKGEGQKIEFKQSKTTLPKDFYETVISFSNTDGGLIFLGVEDSGSICGVNKDSIKQIIADICTTLNSKVVKPLIYVEPKAFEIEGKYVIVIHIVSSSQVHAYNGATYIRRGDVDINISNDKNKIYEVQFQKSNKFTESEIIPFMTFDDLDINLFDKARRLISNYKPNHPWLFVNNEQMLREASLWAKDMRTGKEGLTLAAGLIFGKDTTISNLLPAYKVEAMTRIDNLDRYDDRITLRTNLIDTYIKLHEFIDKHLDDKFYLENGERVDLRYKIFREVIGNMIVHREYTNRISSDLIIYKDEVIVTNPNKAIFHGVLNPEKFSPFAKNPNIRKFFTAFGWTDEIGSGVRNTNKYLPIYTNGAKPKFIEDDVFITEIPINVEPLSKFYYEWINWLELPLSNDAQLLDSFNYIALNKKYKKLEFDDLLIEIFFSWNEKSTQLLDLLWVESKYVTSDEIKKVPSWNEKSTQLLKKRNWYFIAILTLCANAISIKDILSIIGYKNDSLFKNNYIKPLRQSQLITYTDLEKPNSSNNKLVITQKGKDFLVG